MSVHKGGIVQFAQWWRCSYKKSWKDNVNGGCFTVAVFGVIDKCLHFFLFLLERASHLPSKERKSYAEKVSVSVVQLVR